MWIDLFLIGKPFVKITLHISISKTGYGTFIADQFNWINSCTDINFKPRTGSHPGQFHNVKVKRAQLSPKTIDTTQYNNIIYKPLIITSSSFSEHDMVLTC